MDYSKANFPKHKYFLLIGLIVLCVGNILGHVQSETFVINFLTGMFHGLSVPLILFGIYANIRNKKSHS